MAFNGSGTFVLLHNFVTEAASAPIEISKLKDEFDGIATGLSNCIARDGQSTVSADIPFNDKKITGLADATDDTHALNRQTADARYLLDVEEIKRKSADETVNGSATLQDDNHLTGFALTAGEAYEFRGLMWHTTNNTARIKLTLTFSNAPQYYYASANAFSETTSGGGTQHSSSAPATALEVATFDGGLVDMRGFFLANASTGGTVKLQWAQITGTAVDTILKLGSFLRIRKIS